MEYFSFQIFLAKSNENKSSINPTLGIILIWCLCVSFVNTTVNALKLTDNRSFDTHQTLNNVCSESQSKTNSRKCIHKCAFFFTISGDNFFNFLPNTTVWCIKDYSKLWFQCMNLCGHKCGNYLPESRVDMSTTQQ